ncbi:MAG: type II CAAX prenyl endopeptidase Rce1 family protein, partial [Alphaproteobacteria bacterium]
KKNILIFMANIAIVFLLLNFVSFYFFLSKKIPLIIFILMLLSAVSSGVIGVYALPISAFFALNIYCFYQKKLSPKLHFLNFISIIILTLLSFAHLLPSIENIELISNYNLSESNQNFSIWYNFDKPLIAIFMLLFAYVTPKSFGEYKNIVKNSLLIFICLAVMILLIGKLSGFLIYEVKNLNFSIFILWFFKNLFLTIFAEEFFFRFFLQKNLADILQKTLPKFFNKKILNPSIISIIIISIIFGILHLKMGIIFALIAILASFGYGYAYYRTNYIESAILVHFLINLCHFLFFK